MSPPAAVTCQYLLVRISLILVRFLAHWIAVENAAQAPRARIRPSTQAGPCIGSRFSGSLVLRFSGSGERDGAVRPRYSFSSWHALCRARTAWGTCFSSIRQVVRLSLAVM